MRSDGAVPNNGQRPAAEKLTGHFQPKPGAADPRRKPIFAPLAVSFHTATSVIGRLQRRSDVGRTAARVVRSSRRPTSAPGARTDMFSGVCLSNLRQVVRLIERAWKAAVPPAESATETDGAVASTAEAMWRGQKPNEGWFGRIDP